MKQPTALAAGLVLAASMGVGCPQARAAAGQPPPSSQPATVRETVEVMNFQALSEPTTVVFRRVGCLASAEGSAEIRRSQATTKAFGIFPHAQRSAAPGAKTQFDINAAFTGLPPASDVTPGDLAYVLWAVTPEGRTVNLGEVVRAGAEGHVQAKMASPAFGLIVTAEPFFSVSRPSAPLLFAASGAAPAVMPTKVACELLRQSASPPAASRSSPGDPTEPASLREAARALAAADAAGAARYAPQTRRIARQLLDLAREQQAKGLASKTVDETAREAALLAQDARVLAEMRAGRAAADPAR